MLFFRPSLFAFPSALARLARGLALCLACLVCVVHAAPASAEDRLLRIATREGVTVPVFWMPRPGAVATLVLLPGGAGGFGRLDNGHPDGRNFLVRSSEDFAHEGFNVAIVGKPSDKDDLDLLFRTRPEHLADLRAAVAAVRQEANAPVWLVGTSRGTVSAAAAAIAWGNTELAGVVLTSSITNLKFPGALPGQRLEEIRVPVLVVHHARDACHACRPYEVAHIMQGLANAPVKKQLMLDGGTPGEANPCEALHYHGYAGIEQEAVLAIARWIKAPAP